MPEQPTTDKAESIVSVATPIIAAEQKLEAKGVPPWLAILLSLLIFFGPAFGAYVSKFVLTKEDADARYTTKVDMARVEKSQGDMAASIAKLSDAIGTIKDVLLQDVAILKASEKDQDRRLEALERQSQNRTGK